MGDCPSGKQPTRKSPPRKTAAAFVGKVLVARGSCSYVADALGITTRTLRRYVKAGRMHDGLRCVTLPVVYSLIDPASMTEVLMGADATLARKLDATCEEVRAAARTGELLGGMMVAEKTVVPARAPRERIRELREAYVERDMARLARERRLRRLREEGSDGA